jgi:crotonobetainyl-CoA:carnitine CoA-transferase CaiB-like acyl-CoA transferase
VKLGIDYEVLNKIRPNLIWLGVTGFGPDQDEAAYDPVLQARAGWMSLTGEPDGSPLVFGLPMVDLGAAEHAYGAVMKALYRRALVGEGSRIDISMFRSSATWMASAIMLTALGEQVTRRGNTHQFFAPVSVYPTRDGHVYIAVGNDRQWQAIVELPGFQSLNDPAYQRNAGRIADAERLNRRLSACTSALTAAELSLTLNRIGVPVAKVNRLCEVLEDPLLKNAFVHVQDERSHTEVILPPPAVVGAEETGALSFPPRLGEHNEAVYGALLGMNSRRLTELRERGII